MGTPRFLGVNQLDTAWMKSALCAQTDPEIWFPDAPRDSAKAISICKRCFVLDECLSWVMGQEIETFMGVWGGTTHEQRKRLKRGLRKQVAA